MVSPLLGNQQLVLGGVLFTFARQLTIIISTSVSPFSQWRSCSKTKTCYSSSSVTLAFLGTGTMLAILKHVGTADWDRDRLNMSINKPASWSAHALRTRLEMPSGPPALQGLKHLNAFLTSATEKESPQSLLAVRVGGTVLSSKRQKGL